MLRRRRKPAAITTGMLVHHGEQIGYQVVFSQRRTVGIHIYPDKRVIVRAPHGAASHEIAQIVEKRGAWISRHLARLRDRIAEETFRLRFEHAQSLPYLGEALTLHVRQAARTRARHQGDLLIVETAAPDDPAQIERAVERWLRQQANMIFAERLEECHARIDWMQVSLPTLKIRRMRSRWGSCSGAGNVTLNLRLIHLSPEVIDYVIYHELCHLREMNHSRRFYALLQRALPSWQERRAALYAASSLLR